MSNKRSYVEKQQGKKRKKPAAWATSADQKTRTARLKEIADRFYGGINNIVGFYAVLQNTHKELKRNGKLTAEISAELQGAQKAIDFAMRKAFGFSREELTRRLAQVADEYVKVETERMAKQLLEAQEPKSRIILPGAPNPDLRGRLLIPDTIIDTGDPDRKLTPDDLRERGA